jgi:hypothetical protein
MSKELPNEDAGADQIRLKADAYPLDDLVEQVRDGKVRIPGFQRLFRWSEQDVLKLFDSIAKGYPIGTLLLWQRPADAESVQLGPIQIDAPETSSARWVIDGQQRVTTIAGVLLASDDVSDHRFRVFYDLRDQKLKRRGTQPAPAHWLPLNVVLDTGRLLEWLSDYPDRVEAPEHVEGALQLSKRVREYRVPIYLVEGSDEAALRDVFQRVNRGGKPLRAAEVFDALHGQQGGEPASLRALSEALELTGFGHIEEAALLRAVLASRGGDVFRDFENEFSSGAEAGEAFRKADRSLRRTITFLQEECGFPLARVAPQAMAIPTLTRFFTLHPDPHPRSLELLRRWVWRIATTPPDAFTSTLRRAVRAVDDDEHQSVQRLLKSVSRDDVGEVDLHAPRLNTNAGRLAFSLLWALEPVDLRSSSAVDPGQVADERMLVITDSADAELGLADRLFHPHLEEDESISRLLLQADAAALSSHAIDGAALSAFKESDIDGFIQARAAVLARELKKVWIARAAIGVSDRPPIDALADMAA